MGRSSDSSFIGTPRMNVVAAGALPHLKALAGGRVPIDGYVGMRPEALQVKPAGQGALEARVDLVEALGADNLIHVVVDGVALVARQAERTQASAGDRVGLDLDPAGLHFFDGQGRAVRPSA